MHNNIVYKNQYLLFSSSHNVRMPMIYSYLIPYVLLQVYDGRFPVHRCQQYSIQGVLQARRHLNLVFSDFMCRCVACRSGSVPLVWNILALALETVRPLTKDNWKFMKRTCGCEEVMLHTR